MKKLILVLFVLFAVNVISQTSDTIFLINGEIIPCQILDISESGVVTYDYITSDGEKAMAQKGKALIKEIKSVSENLKDSVSQQEIFFMPDIKDTVTLLLSDAINHIEKARKLTNAGIAFGSTANLCVVLDAGLLSGDFDDWQGYVYLVGISTSLIRGGLSFATPGHLRKANNKLLMVRDISGDITLFENPLSHVMNARKASTAVVFLGLAAWCLIPAGFIGITYDESGSNYGNFCYITGWVCAVASLTCTFISSYHISKAKRSMQDDIGTFNLGMNKYGIGISYNF